MIIRRFMPKDAGACAALFYRAVHDGAGEKYSEKERRAWAPKVPDAPDFGKRLGGIDCFVADDGEVKGFMSLTASGYLDMAFVAPEERGKGTARKLYAAILEVARARGLSRLTSHASLYAQPFFSRQGWQIKAAETTTRAGVDIRRFEMFVDLYG